MSLDIDITYVLVLILFLIPLLVLNVLVFRPFLELFEKRHTKIHGVVEAAEKQLLEAEKQAKTFEERISIATSKGLETRTQIRAEAQADMNSKIDAERQRVAEKLKTAMNEVESKRREALAEVQVKAEEFAELTANKLLSREA